MTFCTFHGNSACWGGGLRLRRVLSPKISHCPFTINHANYVESGFGLRHTNGIVTITNLTMIDGTAPCNLYRGFDSHTGSHQLNSVRMADSSPTATKHFCAFGKGNTFISDADETPALISNCLVITRHNSDPLDLMANLAPIVICHTKLLITEDMFENCWTTSKQTSVVISRVTDTHISLC
ncbi:hypothetical protein BLNAU_10782 [Blattamonas nauphoetae]|uniref:Uncharacterized protein n=1 Tax=Blattamonas nauphoetae TaxID=2049346 RepID=A0ABQ9XPE1_9EUKA|nr:hypothetical protein BLNAU_10782 [Blattamonas nauphoetae]